MKWVRGNAMGKDGCQYTLLKNYLGVWECLVKEPDGAISIASPFASRADARFWADACDSAKSVESKSDTVTSAPAVLLSIRPQWLEQIATGAKTVEVRKSRPLYLVDKPFTCYLYQTKHQWDHSKELGGSETAKMLQASSGMVVGEFVCDWVDDIFAIDPLPFGGALDYGANFDLGLTGLEPEGLDGYLAGHDGYGWHISDLKWYDQPKHLSDFYVEETHGQWAKMKPLERPPQSWRYVYPQNPFEKGDD